MRVVYTLLGVAAVVGIGLYVRSTIAPKFEILSVDKIKKDGVFSFSGIENTFSLSGGKSASGRNGFVVTASRLGNNSVIFKLYKNGVFLRDLETVSFDK